MENGSCAGLVLPVCSLGSFECRCEMGYERDGVSCVGEFSLAVSCVDL